MSLHVVLWIVTGLLATVMLISTSKMFVPREKMAAMGGRASAWVLDFSPGALRAIGALELLAAVGLILPAVLDIAPIMVPVTATCVAVLFVGATAMRLRRGERATIVPDLVYLAMAVFVAWGRFGPEPFTG
ncbi:DoxX family protein [Plantactinospora sp. GCM10030261]|uniref:DoxX family protein n=1 Tax=Plantactinospora sp. GCM10030261 TaxID=3273420 RepID=UPI00360AF002